MPLTIGQAVAAWAEDAFAPGHGGGSTNYPSFRFGGNWQVTPEHYWCGWLTFH